VKWDDLLRMRVFSALGGRRPEPARPQIYLSYGMTKCGSTLAFETVRAVLEQGGFDQRKLTSRAVARDADINYVSSVDPHELREMRSEIERIGHPIAVKTHTHCAPVFSEWLEEGFAWAHAVYRDPRDMALSLLDAGDAARRRGSGAFGSMVSLEDALRSVRMQHVRLMTWLREPKVVPLAYDDIAFDGLAVTAELARQVGVRCDENLVRAFVEGERFTQRNKARRDRHVDEMSPDDSERIAAEFSDALRLLGGTRAQHRGWRRLMRPRWRRRVAAWADAKVASGSQGRLDDEQSKEGPR
jgi:hypothetical protein